MNKKIFSVKSKVFVLFLLAFLMSQCANQQAGSAKLPTDIRGIRLEMPKDEAHQRLEEIAKFKEAASKGQEIWTLKDDPNYNNIMIGYDKENTVRYVTATLDQGATKDKKRVKFSDIGDISAAKKESVGNINKYMWDVDAGNEIPEHQVYTYGVEEENLLHFSLVKRMEKEEEEKE